MANVSQRLKTLVVTNGISQGLMIPLRFRIFIQSRFTFIRSGRQVHRFCRKAFGAQVVERHQSDEGFVYHSKVRIGDIDHQLGEVHYQWQPMTSAIYLYVEDVDATYKQALSAGATSALEPTDQPYGDRNAWVNDEFGNIWYLSSWLG